MKFAKPFYTLALLLLCCSMAYSQNAAQVRKLKTELGKITGSKDFKTATIGFCLMDVETGKVLVETNSEKSLIPASTMKLITTGAGLALLGDTFRFKTELGYMGSINKGTLNGDLDIRGSYDPTLGSWRWPQTHIDTVADYFTKSLQQRGIKDVFGGITGPYNRNGFPPGYSIGDIPYKFSVEPLILNCFENCVNENTYTILIPSLENPDLIYYWFNPDPDEKKSNDEISKINNEYPYSIIKKLYFENDSINRTRDKLFSFSEDIKSPSVQFTHYIAKKAIQNNITVGYNTLEYGFDDLTEGAPLDTSQYIFKPLATWYSPSLSEITAKTNAQSINLYAECILRAIGIQKYGPSTLDTSIVAVKTFWKDEVGSLQGLRMTDGSGLSRSNLCTPLLFCKMLTAYTKRDNFNSFYSTIPIAGREGTVKNFAVGTAAENNARLKSGSMSRVKCYAGYVKGKNGKLYAVSIMFNNFEPDATVTAAAAKLIGKVAELKGGKPKKEFVVNRGNK